jgi:hypothetical protein
MTASTLTLPELFTKHTALVHARAFSESMPDRLLEPLCIPQCEDDIRCVDGRKPRSVFSKHTKKSLPTIPLGGAGIGLYFASFAGIYHYEKEHHRNLRIDGSELTEVLEQAFGKPSLHTDEASLQCVDSIPCQGCKHSMTALEDPDISPGARKFLREQYIPKLAEKTTPEIYEGEHTEQAIFVIKPLDVTMAGYPGDGENTAYVYHHGWHKELMGMAAKHIYLEILRYKAPDVTLGALKQSMWPYAKNQLTRTIKILTKDRKIPIFYLTKNRHGDLVVSTRGELPDN